AALAPYGDHAVLADLVHTARFDGLLDLAAAAKSKFGGVEVDLSRVRADGLHLRSVGAPLRGQRAIRVHSDGHHDLACGDKDAVVATAGQEAGDIGLALGDFAGCLHLHVEFGLRALCARSALRTRLPEYRLKRAGARRGLRVEQLTADESRSDQQHDEYRRANHPSSTIHVLSPDCNRCQIQTTHSVAPRL